MAAVKVKEENGWKVIAAVGSFDKIGGRVQGSTCELLLATATPAASARGIPAFHNDTFSYDVAVTEGLWARTYGVTDIFLNTSAV